MAETNLKLPFESRSAKIIQTDGLSFAAKPGFLSNVAHTPEGKRNPGFLKGEVEVPDEASFGADAQVEDMFYGYDDYES